MPNKLKAFTLLELIIGLILSSIMVSAVYTCFLFFSKQINLFYQQNEEFTNVLYFHNILEDDFLNTTHLENNLTQLTLFKVNGDKITYHIKNKLIYRIQNNTITCMEVVTDDSYFIVRSYNHHLVLSINIRYQQQILKNYFLNSLGIANTINKNRYDDTYQ